MSTGQVRLLDHVCRCRDPHITSLRGLPLEPYLVLDPTAWACSPPPARHPVPSSLVRMVPSPPPVAPLLSGVVSCVACRAPPPSARWQAPARVQLGYWCS
jgi:hypothetical protein